MRLAEEKNPPPFRFLKPQEFAALKQEEKITYLAQAIEAVKAGRPLEESPPPKEQH